MNKRWLWILLGVIAFCLVLFSGAIAGAGLTYFALQANPVRAARNMIVEAFNPASDKNEAGVIVLHVDQGSPAAEAGIERGDIILAVGDQEVNSILELMNALGDKSAGDEVTFTVQHCGTSKEFTVQLEERNDHIYLGLQLSRSQIFGQTPLDRGGIVVSSDQLVFIITRVISGSPADEAGLKTGDVISAVNEQAFKSADDLADTIHSYQPGDEITLSISQPGTNEPRQITVTLGENPENQSQAYLGIEYMNIPGPGAVEGGNGQFFHFELPKSDGQHPPFPQLPENMMPFMPGFPQLPEGINRAVVIHTITPQSPAAEAGLEPGDVITAINDETISDLNSFIEVVHSFEPGDMITLTIYRNRENEPLEVEVALGEDPQVPGQAYLGVGIGELSWSGQGNPLIDPENPFHFKFHFPWQDGNPPENRIEPLPGEEA
jgi:S1-C subfamily serine protease